MPLDYKWTDSANVLELNTDLEHGWRRRTKIICLHEEVKGISWRSGHTIRASLNFRAPNKVQQVPESLPAFSATAGDENLKCNFCDHRLTVRVRLINGEGKTNNYLRWIWTSTNKLAVDHDLSVWMNLFGASFHLRTLLVFTPPAGSPPPIVKDFESRFASAGLPSLGKRK